MDETNPLDTLNNSLFMPSYTLITNFHIRRYHCIPANLCGDAREEVVLYNPWDRYCWIYTPPPFNSSKYKGYHATPRQYNARIMD